MGLLNSLSSLFLFRRSIAAGVEYTGDGVEGDDGGQI